MENQTDEAPAAPILNVEEMTKLLHSLPDFSKRSAKVQYEKSLQYQSRCEERRKNPDAAGSAALERAQDKRDRRARRGW